MAGLSMRIFPYSELCSTKSSTMKKMIRVFFIFLICVCCTSRTWVVLLNNYLYCYDNPFGGDLVLRKTYSCNAILSVLEPNETFPPSALFTNGIIEVNCTKKYYVYF